MTRQPMTGGVYAKISSDIPNETHYVILELSKVHVPGDERSKQNPGHGYDAHDVHKVDYLFFTSKMRWEEEIRKRVEAGLEVKAMVVTPAKITTDVKVSIG